MQNKKKIVTVVSAHEGATTWVRMCASISANSAYEVRSFHQYDDARYRSARSTAARLMLRLQTFVLFPLRFVFCTRRLSRTSDVLLVVTSPFFMPTLAALLVDKRKVKLVMLLNDIYPEALVAKKILRRGGGGERLLKLALSAALRRSEAVVFIGESHKAFVAKDIALPALAPIIPVSAHSDPFVDAVRPRTGTPELLYCGTLGLMHDTETFLSWLAARSAADRPAIKFAFYTSGAAKQRFETGVRAALAERSDAIPVAIGNALGDRDWIDAMRRAQVGLVFQDVGSGVVIFPSKAASILASGQALLLVGDVESDLGRLIVSHDCGWVVTPGDLAGFNAGVSGITDPDVLAAKQKNAFALGQNMFGKEAVARSWVRLFDTMFAG